MKPTTDAPRLLPAICWAVAGAPSLCALALAVFRPEDASWPFAAAMCVASLALVVLARRPKGWRVRAVMVVLPLFLFTWPEVMLRVGGFRHDHALTIQFGYPPPDVMVKLGHDPELFWKLPARYPGTNSDGFLGAEFEIPKPEGTYRMLFFGDSCTMQGYPSRVTAAVGAAGGRALDAVNFGVAGYTSYQGVVLAKRWVDRLKPDLGVVFFGWNDHWLAYGAPDHEKVLGLSGWRRDLQAAARSSRAAQWLSSLATSSAATPTEAPRVSIERYEQNLELIGGLVEAAGGRVLLLTAPTMMFESGVPEYLIPRFAQSAAAVLDWHRRYNDVVRQLASRRGWRLLDLAAVLPLDRGTDLMRSDRIHFTEAGLSWVAEEIAAEVRDLTK